MLRRNTHTKEAITKVFSTSPIPMSLRDVYAVVKRDYPDTAYSTVFRIVQKLHTDGKLLQIDWRERGSRYEWAEKKHHHHLICNACGVVQDVDDSLLRFSSESVSTKTGFKIEEHSIEIFGLCPPCQENTYYE